MLKVAASVIFPTSVMILFEIHQRFKGHFLNELRVSFKSVIYERYVDDTFLFFQNIK